MFYALRVLPACLLVASAAGCGGNGPTVAAQPAAAPPAGTGFDPERCGRVVGRVVWSGPRPTVNGFIAAEPQPDGTFAVRTMPNPHAPQIDPGTNALAGAVVMLRGVDPAAARPWDHPPARVELADRDVWVRQGDGPRRRVGFVRRGDAVAMESKEPVFHTLRARGAAFFTLAFPDPGRPLPKSLDTAGRVELTSGAGFYWAAAHLFVSGHPYLAVTDADGRFVLDRVPAGPAEVAVWVPDWTVAKAERDPETGFTTRQTYAPAVEVAAKAAVEPGRAAAVTLVVPAASFRGR